MTRSQMIETVARKTGFTEAQVETTMDAMFDQIADCLRKDRCQCRTSDAHMTSENKDRIQNNVTDCTNDYT